MARRNEGSSQGSTLRQAELDQVGLFLPWSEVALAPGRPGEPAGEERWMELVVGVLAEIDAVHRVDPALAFRRLMALVRLVDATAWARNTRGAIEPWALALREHTTAFLHALVDGRPGLVADRLLTVLIHPELDLALVDDQLLGRLAPEDRFALLGRLAAVDPAGLHARRLQVLLTAVLLSEPDSDRLVRTAERLGLWERVNAAALLRHLLAEGRPVPALPQLAARALVAGGADQGPSEVVERWLSWCEATGEVALARRIRHQAFAATLSVPIAREILPHLPTDADRATEEAGLLRLVQQHPDRGLALEFLIAWPDLERAAEHALAHAAAMGGLGYEQLERASRALEDASPVAALRLMRKACEGVTEDGSVSGLSWTESFRMHPAPAAG